MTTPPKTAPENAPETETATATATATETETVTAPATAPETETATATATATAPETETATAPETATATATETAPATAPVTATATATAPAPAPARRFTVLHTLGAALVFVAAQLVPVPGTSEIALNAEYGGPGPGAGSWLFGLFDWAPPLVPVLSSGLAATLAFGWLIAGVALSADPTDRARAIARRVVLGVLLVIAAVQGWAISLWLEASSYDYDASWRSRLLVLFAFVAGAALLWACARWIDARGVGQGPLVLLLVHTVIVGASSLGGAAVGLGRGELTPLTVLLELLTLAPWIALALVLALRSPAAWPVPLVRAVRLGSGWDVLGAQALGSVILGGPAAALDTRLPGGPAAVAALHLVVGLAVAVPLVVVLTRRGEHRRRPAWLAMVVALPLAATAWVAIAAVVAGGGVPAFARPSPFAGNGHFGVVVEQVAPDALPARAHAIATRDAQTMARRLEELGVDARVNAAGARVEIELHDVSGPGDILAVVLPSRQLAFRLLAADQSALADVPIEPPLRRESDYPDGSRIVAPSIDALEAALRRFTPPSGLELLYECEELREPSAPGATECSPRLLEPAALTDADVADASVATDPQAMLPYVALQFTERGGQVFEALTARAIHRKLAIVLDGRILSSPVIQSRIPGGRAQITLGRSRSAAEVLQEAQSLALAMRAGALRGQWRPASIDAIAPD